MYPRTVRQFRVLWVLFELHGRYLWTNAMTNERDYFTGVQTQHNLREHDNRCPDCGHESQQSPKVSRYFCNNRLCDVVVFRE